VAWADYPGGS
jgi:hypothetical protein